METYTTVACLDCAQAEINADYTGMGPDREAQVRSAQAFLKEDGYRIVVDTDKVNDFSSERCGVCDTMLAGHRFGAVLVPL